MGTYISFHSARNHMALLGMQHCLSSVQPRKYVGHGLSPKKALRWMGSESRTLLIAVVQNSWRWMIGFRTRHGCRWDYDVVRIGVSMDKEQYARLERWFIDMVVVSAARSCTRRIYCTSRCAWCGRFQTCTCTWILLS